MREWMTDTLPAQFIISLDFELLWGGDQSDRERYGRHVLGA